MPDTSGRSDARTRVIEAKPAQVFAAIRDPLRLARWWGPDGFSSTVHQFEFHPGGKWLLTLHGPDGRNYTNEYRLLRAEPDRMVQIEHPSDDHFFVLTIELTQQGEATVVSWQQTFSTVEHYRQVADLVAQANEQVLERLAAEAVRPSNAR